MAIVQSMLNVRPDGTIVVNNGQLNLSYSDTLENFQLDTGGASGLPDLNTLGPAIDELMYNPGVRNAYIRNESVVDGGDINWDVGNQIIENIGTAIDAQTARQAADAPLLESKTLGMQQARMALKS